MRYIELLNTNIKITEDNQYEVQKYLFKNGYSWITTNTNLFDALRGENEKYIRIDNEGFIYNEFESTHKIIDGEILLRKNKIKRLL